MRPFIPITILAIAFSGCASGPNWKRQTFAFRLPSDPPTPNATGQLVALSRVSISPIFQSRSFVYRTGEDSYEQDPYAGFFIAPEQALAESIRAWMRASGVFGRVLEPGSSIAPNRILEVSIDELYGDFRDPSRPVGTMAIHVLCSAVQDGLPRRIDFDLSCSGDTPLSQRTPAALMAAWDADLAKIMNQIKSEYAKTSSDSH